MNFYNHYFDHKKEELSSLLFECQKFIINKNTLNSSADMIEFNFLDFVFSIIYILYNLNITGTKEINLNEELYRIFVFHEDYLSDNYFKKLFKEETVINVFRNHLDLLKRVFDNYSTKSFNGYSVMSLDQFKTLIKNCLKKKKKDSEIEKILSRLQFRSVDFLDFLLYIVNVADINDDNLDTEIGGKVGDFIYFFNSL
jgi:hypothetical protein